MSAPVHAGGCRCGRVRFEATGAPIRVGVCHCDSCRRSTGSAFATFVDFPRAAVVFATKPDVWSSRPGVERLFCATCGTPIGLLDEDVPPEANLYLGAFDDPTPYTPHDVTGSTEALGWAAGALAPLDMERRG